MNKKNLKIAGATSMTLFSLVAVFTAVIAWFVQNESVHGSGMTIKGTADSGRLNKIEIYTLKEINTKNGKENYAFNDSPSATMTYIWDSTPGTGMNSFPMGDYNPLSTEHPLLLLFTLKGEYVSLGAGDLFIRGTTAVAGFLGETISRTITVTNDQDEEEQIVVHEPRFNLDVADANHPCLKKGTKQMTVDGVERTIGQYPLSSAVNFKCTQYSALEFEGDVEEGIVGVHDSANQTIDILTESVKLKESFVNFETGSDIEFKNNPMIYSSPASTSTNQVKIQYIAMVVNYDSNAIGAIYSTYLGNSILENDYGGALCFYCDWSLEVF